LAAHFSSCRQRVTMGSLTGKNGVPLTEVIPFSGTDTVIVPDSSFPVVRHYTIYKVASRLYFTGFGKRLFLLPCVRSLVSYTETVGVTYFGGFKNTPLPWLFRNWRRRPFAQSRVIVSVVDDAIVWTGVRHHPSLEREKFLGHWRRTQSAKRVKQMPNQPVVKWLQFDGFIVQRIERGSDWLTGLSLRFIFLKKKPFRPLACRLFFAKMKAAKFVVF